jgi:hypothetical protein
MSGSGCPDLQVLDDYAAGRLQPQVRAAVEQHVAGCSVCGQRLSSAPTLGGIGKTADVSKTVGEEPVEPDDESNAPQLDDFLKLNFLQPSTNPQALGRLGNNEVLGVLGRGAMGIVLKAYDTSLCRHVAIKVLAPALAASAKAHERFKREAKAAAGLNHPNVVIIHAVDEQAHLPYMVMEYVAGTTLRQRIRSGQRFELSSLLRIGAQIAAGLAAAHDHGVIHRDIKPANIMLEDGIERVKITDFGLARVMLDASKITSVGLIVGTPSYMSPEQIDGAAIDPRSDLFSLGCVFYAMITGHSPFQAVHPIEIARRVRELDPPPLHERDASVPRFFSDIVAKLLEKKPEDRYESAAELNNILSGHLAEANLGRYGVLARPAAARGGRRSLRVGTKAAALVAAAGLVLAALWFAWSQYGSRGGRQANLQMTVGPQGQYQTLQDALGRAGPGAVIRILDAGTYQGPLVIDDGERLRDLVIEAPEHATLENTATLEPVISVTQTAGLKLRGLKLRARHQQHALAMRGRCPGLTIADVSVSQPELSPYAAMVFWKDSGGDKDRPVSIKNVEMRSGEIGIAIVGTPKLPASWFVIEGCRFQGAGVLVVLEHAVQDVRIVRSLFVNGGGLGFNMEKETGVLRGIHVANNTFFENRVALNFEKSRSQGNDLRIERNLLIQTTPTRIDGDVNASWFADNWWEPVKEADAAQGNHVTPVKDLKLLSRDPGSADFLRPAAKTLTIATPPGSLLDPYIGALAPAEAAR